jgi:hypothetical protein
MDATESGSPPARLTHVRAVLAVMQHVGTNPELFTGPQPVAAVLDAVPSMPLGYDEGALLDELVRMNVRDRDTRFCRRAGAVEAASAKAEPAKVKQVTLGGKASENLAAQFRDAASRAGTNVSALIAQFIADYVAAS